MKVKAQEVLDDTKFNEQLPIVERAVVMAQEAYDKTKDRDGVQKLNGAKAHLALAKKTKNLKSLALAMSNAVRCVSDCLGLKSNEYKEVDTMYRKMLGMPEVVKQQPREYKTLETFTNTSTNMESYIIESDRGGYNVMVKDLDSGKMLPNGFTGIKSLEQARETAKKAVGV